MQAFKRESLNQRQTRAYSDPDLDFVTTHAERRLDPQSFNQIYVPEKLVVRLATLSTLGCTFVRRLAERDVRAGSEVGLRAVTVVECLLRDDSVDF